MSNRPRCVMSCIEISRALVDSEMSIGQLADHFGCSRGSMYASVWQLHAVGVVHIAGRLHGRGAVTFRFGAGDDAFYRERATPKVSTLKFLALFDALRSPDGISKIGLQRSLGTAHKDIRRYIDFLMELRLVHIADWDRIRNYPLAMYAWGIDKPNAPRPKKASVSQIGKKYRAARAQKSQQVALLNALRPDLFRDAA